MAEGVISRRVFVTGINGFVGQHLLDELLRRNCLVRGLMRTMSKRTSRELYPVVGTLDDPKILLEGATGVDAIIHLVGIIEEKPKDDITFRKVHVEGTRAILEAAKKAAVRRYIHMSALGTRPDAVSQYHRTKFEAEELVRNSGLDWTILRPSMIHGPGGFMKMEEMWAKKKAPPPLFIQPFMPYFSSKPLGLIQPVYVEDVARAFVDSLFNDRTIRNTYDLGGPDPMTWPFMHQIASRVIVGHDRLTAPIPAGVCKAMAAIGLGKLLGFNRDQVIMATEQNVCDLTTFIETFGWIPRAFEPTLRQYADRI